MGLMDHVTLNFNNSMSMAAVFLAIKNAFDITWHPGLLHQLSKLEFSASLILSSSFLSQRKCRVSAGGKMSMPREMQAGVPQGSVLSPTLYSMYINDTPETPGLYLTLFADDTCMYAADCREGWLCSQKAAACSEFS
jgi:hypothetical protein